MSFNLLVIDDQALEYDPKDDTLANKLPGQEPRFVIWMLNRSRSFGGMPEVQIELKSNAPPGVSVQTLKQVIPGTGGRVVRLVVTLVGAEEGQSFGFAISVEEVGVLDPRVRVVPNLFRTKLDEVQASFPELEEPAVLRQLQTEIEVELTGDSQSSD